MVKDNKALSMIPKPLRFEVCLVDCLNIKAHFLSIDRNQQKKLHTPLWFSGDIFSPDQIL